MTCCVCLVQTIPFRLSSNLLSNEKHAKMDAFNANSVFSPNRRRFSAPSLPPLNPGNVSDSVSQTNAQFLTAQQHTTLLAFNSHLNNYTANSWMPFPPATDLPLANPAHLVTEKSFSEDGTMPSKKGSKRKNPIVSPQPQTSQSLWRPCSSSQAQILSSAGLPPPAPQSKTPSNQTEFAVPQPRSSGRRHSISHNLANFNIIPGGETPRPVPVGAVVARSTGAPVLDRAETTMQRFKKDVGNVVARRGSLSSCLEGSLVLSQPLVGPDGQSRFQMQCQQNSSRSTSGSSRLSAILNAAKATLASGPVSPQMHESPTSAAAVESPPAANEASSPDIGSSSAFNNSEPSFMALLSESNMERSWSKGQPALHMNLLDANLIQPYYFSYPLNLQHQTQAFVFPQEPMPPYSFHHPNPTPSQHHGLNIPPAMSLEAAYIFQNQRAVSSGPSSNLFPTPPRELTAYGLNNSTDISLNFIGSEFDSTTSSTSRVPNHTTHSEFFEMTRDSWFVS